MKKIEDFDFYNKKVILRVDFNVSIKDSKIISNDRIIAAMPTIKYLIEKQAKIILMSHLGKIKTKEDTEKNSLYIVYQELCKLIDTPVYFSSSTHGDILESKITALKNGEILLMENTRFEDLEDKKESNCDMTLSKYWASLGDIFINDAFGLSHRKHASNYGITKYIPSGIGFLMQKELEGLEPIINPIHPFVVIMGGAKLEDKIALIKSILPKCDKLLLTGGIANTFLKTEFNIGRSLYSEESVEEVKKILSIYKERIILPKDCVVESIEKINQKNVNEIDPEDIIYDIGSKTIESFKEVINNAKTIFLNGTAGKYELENFETGTKAVLELVSKSNAYTVIGGGDALSSSEYFNIDGFSFKSTGGGATLDYIANGKLKCLEDENTNN